MESIWQKSTELPAFPQLSGSMNTDVLIIGGGIAGILTAYFLKQSGADCILVEKGRICQGTTSHTTAKITYQHGLVYHKILKSSGLVPPQNYLGQTRLALESMKSFAGTSAAIMKSRTITSTQSVTEQSLKLNFLHLIESDIKRSCARISLFRFLSPVQ